MASNRFSFDLPRKAVVNFDGETVFTAEFVKFDPRPTGDSYSPRPYLALFYRVKETGDIFSRKLYVYEILDTIATDKDGNSYTRKSPQDRVRIEISRAAGKQFDDIDDALEWIAKAPRKVLIKENPVLDDDGEVRRDDKGVPMKWYAMRYYIPGSKAEKKEASAPERAAEAEAKRAAKGKRGYAGNTGDC